MKHKIKLLKIGGDYKKQLFNQQRLNDVEDFEIITIKNEEHFKMKILSKEVKRKFYDKNELMGGMLFLRNTMKQEIFEGIYYRESFVEMLNTYIDGMIKLMEYKYYKVNFVDTELVEIIFYK